MTGRRSAEWEAGAHAEAAARREGISDGARQVIEYVEALSRTGMRTERDEITESVARVFTAGWRRRDRIRLAWRLVRR